MDYLQFREVIDANMHNDLSSLSGMTVDTIIGFSLGDIPSGAIEAFYTMLKATRSISNKIFADKLVSFFYGMSKAPLSDKVKFMNKHINGSEDKFYSRLLLLIDGVSDLNCAIISGRLMRALIHEKISTNEFMLCIYSVRNSISETLLTLNECKPNERYALTDENMLLSSAGLMYIDSSILCDSKEDMKCELTRIGELVIKYGISEDW